MPGEGGLFEEVQSDRRGGGLYTCMFIYPGIDTCTVAILILKDIVVHMGVHN